MSIKHEFRLLLRDRQVAWLGAFLVFIFLTAFWSGSNDQSDFLRKSDEAKQVASTQALTLFRNLELVESGKGASVRPDPTSPVTVAYATNPYVAIKTTPLAITAVGESDVKSSLVRLGNPMDPTWVNEEITNPLALANGRFDLVFVAVVLLPLVVIALMFRLYSGEEEGGTRFLLAATDLGLWKILARRSLLRFFVLSLFVVTLFVAGIFLTVPTHPFELMLCWCAYVISYLGFWFLMCFVVVARRWGSGANIAALTAIWVFLVMLVPISANAIVSSGESPLDRLDTLLKFRALNEHTEPTAELVSDFHRDVGVQNLPKDDPTSQFFAVRHFALKEVRRAMLLSLDSAVRREDSLDVVGLINPSVKLNSLLVGLAGRNARAYQDFQKYLAIEDKKRRDHFMKLRLTKQKMSSEDRSLRWALSPQNAPTAPSLVDGWSLLVWSLIIFTLGKWNHSIKQRA